MAGDGEEYNNGLDPTDEDDAVGISPTSSQSPHAARLRSLVAELATLVASYREQRARARQQLQMTSHPTAPSSASTTTPAPPPAVTQSSDTDNATNTLPQQQDPNHTRHGADLVGGDMDLEAEDSEDDEDDEDGDDVDRVVGETMGTMRQCMQFVAFGAVRHSDAVELMERLVETARRAAGWPRVPTRGGPPAGCVLYFRHPGQGRLRTKWADPVEFTQGGIRCDVCSRDWIQCSYRVVQGGSAGPEGGKGGGAGGAQERQQEQGQEQEEEEVDTSSYHVDRIGWDVCAECAVVHCSGWFDEIRSCAQSAVLGPGGCVRAIPSYAEEYQLRVSGTTCCELGVTLVVEVSQTGEKLKCIAVPEAEVSSPNTWQFQRACTVPLDVPTCGKEERCPICLEPVVGASLKVVLTACGHWFHDQCVRRHLRSQRSASCPMCRCENVLPPRKHPTGQVTLNLSHSHTGCPLDPGTKYIAVVVVYTDDSLPLQSAAVILCTRICKH
ncbi:hypothetical protein Pelo_7441 [Pelomyxa schiedti]|nr:hypothetical protein Pelo_7441 [Pelomyxa schiedti]